MCLVDGSHFEIDEKINFYFLLIISLVKFAIRIRNFHNLLVI